MLINFKFIRMESGLS